MTRKLFAGFIGATSVVCSLAQPNILEIAEVNEALTATLNGTTPVPIDITGAPNNWTVELPGGFSFNAALVGTGFLLGEPESIALENDVFITQPTFLTWQSDLPASGGLLLNPILVPNAGTLPSGAPFDLVLADRLVSTPDAGSTLALAGVALLAIGSLRSMIREA